MYSVTQKHISKIVFFSKVAIVRKVEELSKRNDEILKMNADNFQCIEQSSDMMDTAQLSGFVCRIDRIE